MSERGQIPLSPFKRPLMARAYEVGREWHKPSLQKLQQDIKLKYTQAKKNKQKSINFWDRSHPALSACV